MERTFFIPHIQDFSLQVCIHYAREYLQCTGYWSLSSPFPHPSLTVPMSVNASHGLSSLEPKYNSNKIPMLQKTTVKPLLYWTFPLVPRRLRITGLLCTVVCWFLLNLHSPLSSHVLCFISPWLHLLYSGSSKFSCLFMTWLKKDLNLAYITLPFPDKVEVALQRKWFSQGRIQLIRAMPPLSLLILVKTLRISMDKILTITNYNLGCLECC